MSKYLVNLPDQVMFSTNFTVDYGYLNMGNHLAADKMLTIAIEAMCRIYTKIGYSDPRDMDGGWLFMTNSQVDYVSECIHGDKLIIDVEVIQSGEKTLDYVFLITKSGNGQQVARIKTRNLFFDRSLQKPAAIPTATLTNFNRLGNPPPE